MDITLIIDGLTISVTVNDTDTVELSLGKERLTIHPKPLPSGTGLPPVTAGAGIAPPPPEESPAPPAPMPARSGAPSRRLRESVAADPEPGRAPSSDRATGAPPAKRPRSPIIVEIEGTLGVHPAKEAAALLGVTYGFLTSILCIAAGGWATVKGRQVRRILPAPAPAMHEARPRHANGTSTPINPGIIGGAARISHADNG